MAKSILIVDDSASLRQVVSIALKGAGYEVLEGVDGADALTKLDGRKIHLIISDVNMPRMDGISFVKAVKELAAYKFTPIIMLTTESQEAKKREGQAAGAKAWVVKPFVPETLLGAVQKLVLP
jgi:two-component system chemotaxis response regulator CheY